MATHYSDQANKMFGKATAGIVESAKGSEVRGKVRVMVWDFTVPAGNAAINDLIVLGILPKGYRLLGGRSSNTAMTTGAGDATARIGAYTRNHAGVLTLVDVDLYATTYSVDAAGEDNFADTAAQSLLAAAGADEHVVVAEVLTEAWAAAGTYKGWLKYIAPDS